MDRGRKIKDNVSAGINCTLSFLIFNSFLYETKLEGVSFSRVNSRNVKLITFSFTVKLWDKIED